LTIRKGEPWGEPGPTPPDLVVLRSDLEVHRWVIGHRQAGTPIAPFGLAGGDLARTVAGGSPDQFQGCSVRLTLDLVRVEVGQQVTWSASHVIARRSWWRGELMFAMTAQFYGGYDVTPRGHPNDGRMDVLTVDAALPARVRAQARSRARTGSHLPHPALAVRQVQEWTAEFARPLVVWVDGRRWVTAEDVRLVVEPDAYTAYI
jgi:hypothetical protein